MIDCFSRRTSERLYCYSILNVIISLNSHHIFSLLMEICELDID